MIKSINLFNKKIHKLNLLSIKIKFSIMKNLNQILKINEAHYKILSFFHTIYYSFFIFHPLYDFHSKFKNPLACSPNKLIVLILFSLILWKSYEH